MKFVTAVLNSTLMDWVFRITSTNNHLNMYELEALPIPAATSAQQKPIVALVDRILSAKRRNPSADTSDLERQIDALVYKLYGLSKDEIAVVEGRISSTTTAQHATPHKLQPSQPQTSQKKKRTPKFEEEF